MDEYEIICGGLRSGKSYAQVDLIHRARSRGLVVISAFPETLIVDQRCYEVNRKKKV